jgi:hypothetical protein
MTKRNSKFDANEFVEEEVETVAEDVPTVTEAPKFFTNTPEKKRGKEYPLQCVLHVITGRMFVKDYDDIFAFMGYVTGIRGLSQPLYPIVLEGVREELLRQLPEMEYFTKKENVEFEAEDLDYWLSKQFKKFGTDVFVEKMADDDADALDQKVEALKRQLDKANKKPKFVQAGASDSRRL